MPVSTIPFSGFYQSHHDAEIDRAIEQLFTDANTGNEINSGLVSKFYNRCDFTAVHISYAKAYVENMATEFKLKMTFESMSSPKEYNFDTDRIFVNIDESEVLRLFQLVTAEELEKVAKDQFTSCSGFTSFYSNDPQDWGPIDEWDHNQIGALVTAYINMGSDFDHSAEYGLMESEISNSSLENWLSSANPDSARLFRIHEYIESRKDRK